VASLVLAFACPVCDRLVTFESSVCLHCASEIGFDPPAHTMLALEPAAPEPLLRCANAQLAACNWLTHRQGELCASCALTRTRPNDADEAGLGGFAAAEAAKRWLLFELADLRLPVVGWRQQPGGLAFELLSSRHEAVTTGHADGVITLDLDETDPAHRERMRVRLDEPYRTVLGHLRHEIGHYYQPILLAGDADSEQRCRELFGDEREDYQLAIDRHYRQGPPAGWDQLFVSAYASMHPWEDWAETFAHYLHLRDTLQTAASYGVRVQGPAVATADIAPLHSQPEHARGDIHSLLQAWIPLTYALNAISRSMGAADLYPFVLTPQIEAKLALVDDLVRRVGRRAPVAGSA
jgi:hypothetical protein